MLTLSSTEATARLWPDMGRTFWTPMTAPISTAHKTGMSTIAALPRGILCVPAKMATAQTAVDSRIIDPHCRAVGVKRRARP